MEQFFHISGSILIGLMFLVLVRVILGPTIIDRIIGVNVIGTKSAVLLILIGFQFGRVEMFVDIALAYALLNFIGSIAASKIFKRSRQVHKEDNTLDTKQRILP